jgi:uncharacterized membrane protein YdjX (TVP38/TMEM64 family)
VALARRPSLILRLAFIVIFSGILLWFAFGSDLRPRSIADAKADLAFLGIWPPLAAILLQAIGVVMLIPGFILIVATAIIFGLDSIWISLVGQTLGSLIAYTIGRLAGRDILHAILGQRMIAIERLLEKNGFQYLLIMRLMSLIPLPFLAYGPGVVRVPLKAFTLATILGEAPFIVVFALFGDSLGSLKDPSDVLSPVFFFPLILLIALVSFPVLISIIIRRRRRRHPSTEPVGVDEPPPGPPT